MKNIRRVNEEKQGLVPNQGPKATHYPYYPENGPNPPPALLTYKMAGAGASGGSPT